MRKPYNGRQNADISTDIRTDALYPGLRRAGGGGLCTVSVSESIRQRVVPEQPYTSADLNYNDASSRSSLEQGDDAARPAIIGAVENMKQYDVVFLGYSIWHGQALKILRPALWSRNVKQPPETRRTQRPKYK